MALYKQSFIIYNLTMVLPGNYVFISSDYLSDSSFRVTKIPLQNTARNLEHLKFLIEFLIDPKRNITFTTQ